VIKYYNLITNPRKGYFVEVGAFEILKGIDFTKYRFGLRSGVEFLRFHRLSLSIYVDF
jgi:hypothetical protein